MVLAQDTGSRAVQRPHTDSDGHSQPVRPPVICIQRHATAMVWLSICGRWQRLIMICHKVAPAVIWRCVNKAVWFDHLIQLWLHETKKGPFACCSDSIPAWNLHLNLVCVHMICGLQQLCYNKASMESNGKLLCRRGDIKWPFSGNDLSVP